MVEAPHAHYDRDGSEDDAEQYSPPRPYKIIRLSIEGEAKLSHYGLALCFSILRIYNIVVLAALEFIDNYGSDRPSKEVDPVDPNLTKM